MKIDNTDTRFNRVTPESGMWLFNGGDFAEVICTPKDADLSSWQEVTEDFKLEYEREHPSEFVE
jgi:hypothetical protein